MLNYGEFVHGASFDPDLQDASGRFVTVRDAASFFDSVTSFEIARSGRLDTVVLGAYEVGANGDLANWSVPGMTGGGIGGAMDLASGRGRSSRCASTPTRRASRSWSVRVTSRSPRRGAWTRWSPTWRCCSGRTAGSGWRRSRVASPPLR
jgi:acyl CoA:acetate/3-ketoacid CoA transferase beta subunit